jgi:hypothetical protein
MAPFDVPAHDNSAMDGFAVRAADLAREENRLEVLGAAYAGRGFTGLVGPGQAVRVMTGAVLPLGSDTVVMQEAARMEGDTLVLPRIDKRGQNVRRAGGGPGRGTPRTPRRAAYRPGGAGSARLAGSRRGAGPPSPAGGLLLHRRRALLYWAALGPRASMRPRRIRRGNRRTLRSKPFAVVAWRTGPPRKYCPSRIRSFNEAPANSPGKSARDLTRQATVGLASMRPRRIRRGNARGVRDGASGAMRFNEAPANSPGK